MCCCGDGDTHIPGTKKRKRRAMGANIQGYNVSCGDARTSLGIHLRLRRPKSHGLLSYETVAAVMAHELAHVRFGAHSAEFYELAEEIAVQHVQFVTSGVVLDKDGFPMGSSSEARRLGGLSRRLDVVSVKDRAAMAALRRAKVGDGGSGCSSSSSSRRLGGGGDDDGVVVERKWNGRKRSVREMAAIAAQRRQRDSLTCQFFPKSSDDGPMICIPVDGSNDNEISESSNGEKKGIKMPLNDLSNSPRINLANTKEENNMIDLTEDDQDVKKVPAVQMSKPKRIFDNSWYCQKCTFYNNTAMPVCEMCGKTREKNEGDFIQILPDVGQQQENMDVPLEIGIIEWNCSRCTYRNRPDILSCEICRNPKLSEGDNALIAKRISKADHLKAVKEKEKQKSLEEFNGFNIYGSSGRKTSTMKHLT